MALASGTRFGSYEIADAIGHGGMGEVYRAKDTTLERDVAIKVLPESFAADKDRIARFEQEAKTLASLNHANIAQIFGLERSGDSTAIVMELVDGPTLADRIEQGPLAADEALNIAMQIADALEAAHGQGIVHRDLKPANIKLRDDGTVKVLDFGIAKALDTHTGISGPQQPSLTTPAMTLAGVILGTAAYMSPEQARGKFVDERTDVWAFGCVLYEMLTGQPAFGGEDITITLARVAIDSTDFDSLPATIPEAVRHTIKLCLEKDPRKRISDIRDVRLALEGTFESDRPKTATQAQTKPPWQRALMPVGAFVVGGLIIGAGLMLLSAPAPLQVDRFIHAIPDDQPLRNVIFNPLAVAPNGRRIAYNTQQGLFLRDMDELAARPIPGTEENILRLFFSPDAQSIAYLAGGNLLKRIAIDGGAPIVISEGITGFTDGNWAADGVIYFAGTLETGEQGIFRVPGNGGMPVLVIEPEEGEQFSTPQLLPDGDTILFTVSPQGGGNYNEATIVAQSMTTGEERTVLAQGGRAPRYVPTGHLIYSFEDTLRGLPLDLDTLTVSGGAVSLVQGLLDNPLFVPFAPYAVADDGTLIYIRGGSAQQTLNSAIWVDREGGEELVGLEPCVCLHPVISPDGAQVALSILATGEGTGADVWVWSFTQNTLRRLTFDTVVQALALWSLDGMRIAYTTVGQGIEWRPADGTGAAEPLVDGTATAVPLALSDDDELIFVQTAGGGTDIAVVSVNGDQEPRTLLGDQASEGLASLSPDGRWLAYESDETGEPEIYVRPYPDVDTGKWQISSGGGQDPEWSADGTRLFFLSPTHIMEADVESDPTFSWDTPQAVIDVSSYATAGNMGPPRSFDVSPDGERFLLLKQGGLTGEAEAAEIVIVQNWFEELKVQVPID